MPDLLQGGVGTVGSGGGAGAGGQQLLVIERSVGEVTSRLQSPGKSLCPDALLTWHHNGGLNPDLTPVLSLSELGEDGGIVNTAVPVIVQPLRQHGGRVLELGSGGGGGSEDGDSEHRRVLR